MAIETSTPGIDRGGVDSAGPDGSSDTICAEDRQRTLAYNARRCGSDVVRLVGDSEPVVTTIFGTGFRRVRVRNGATIASLESGAISLDSREGVLEFRGRNSALRFRRSTWCVAFLQLGFEADRSLILAYDECGNLGLEFVLERSDVESLAEFLPRIEHPRQRPSTHLGDGVEPETILRTDLDEDVLERRWRETSTYGEIAELARGFRVDRTELFRALPDRWASRIDPRAVYDLAVEIRRNEFSSVVETRAPGSETKIRTSNLRATGRGGPVVAVGGDENLVFDPRAVASAFAVRKPTPHGLVSAVEFFDESETMQARLRLSQRAELHERLTWRSCLPHGRVCSSTV